ncbi:hypothetical protein C5167_012083 [Papaver somniferum]|uniref:DOG1 domain-containing protein n=2 Tax=Papaver somniferum TaxID=3469 RepID=A0A4Y7J0E5_PAPSO|nr:hypothetical protein C5167_012083 [Papaver somniferum]
MMQQQEDLKELLEVYHENRNDEQKLRLIIDKTIKHLEEYTDKRSQLAVDDAPSFFSPTWLTSVENCYLWLGGCRPSLSIRLVYSLCGSELEEHLTEFLQGVRTGNLGELSADQLGLVSDLQCRTIKEEEVLSSKMAGLQENIAGHQLTALANNWDHDSSTAADQSTWQEVRQALDSHAKALASIFVEADQLRLNTLKELTGILTPYQAVDFLVASKKLHICIHQWGLRRGSQRGAADEGEPA